VTALWWTPDGIRRICAEPGCLRSVPPSRTRPRKWCSDHGTAAERERKRRWAQEKRASRGTGRRNATRRTSDIDIVAVELACAGHSVTLNQAERRLAVAVLTARGMAADEIGERLRISSRQVVRERAIARQEAAATHHRPGGRVSVIPFQRPARIYLAGPMRGRVGFNFPTFAAAAAELRAFGYKVVSPAEHDLELGFDPDQPLEVQGFDLKAALAWDLEQVLTVDAVVVLPGWSHSAGALAEVATARAVGTPVLDYAEIVEHGTEVAA
jgi:hypothetical protein